MLKYNRSLLRSEKRAAHVEWSSLETRITEWHIFSWNVSWLRRLQTVVSNHCTVKCRNLETVHVNVWHTTRFQSSSTRMIQLRRYDPPQIPRCGAPRQWGAPQTYIFLVKFSHWIPFVWNKYFLSFRLIRRGNWLSDTAEFKTHHLKLAALKPKLCFYRDLCHSDRRSSARWKPRCFPCLYAVTHFQVGPGLNLIPFSKLIKLGQCLG